MYLFAVLCTARDSTEDGLQEPLACWALLQSTVMVFTLESVTAGPHRPWNGRVAALPC